MATQAYFEGVPIRNGSRNRQGFNHSNNRINPSFDEPQVQMPKLTPLTRYATVRKREDSRRSPPFDSDATRKWSFNSHTRMRNRI